MDFLPTESLRAASYQHRVMALPRSSNLLILFVMGAAAATTRAADAPAADPIGIHRTPGPIKVDGDLSDEGWKGAARIDTWYETNPGDNTSPKVKNVGYLTYDDHAFYAGFEFDDPEPGRIRAPLGDRDNVPGSTDYGGVLLDTRNDGKTGLLLLSNPRGIQYDAVMDDVAGNEDSSPDFFFDSKGRITPTGWTLELKIPFSSLRYPKGDPRTWRIMLYRNYPRDYRYQFFNVKLPRGGSCFVCRSGALTGLQGLPSGGHLILAPYVTGRDSGAATDGPGTPWVDEKVKGDGGLDLKWTPFASTAVDATLNPDFSQIESDVAQIGANERFALFFPEKRPFFLEGVELLSTPIQAVYTRTITAPRWGVRGTGKFGSTAYTALFAQDGGGGSAILPGPNESDLADQEFRSLVAVGRLRRDIGRSSVSVLGTAREIQGGGHNRVGGPDFQWRPSDKDTVTGQVLFSDSRTPVRPDLADEWDGRSLHGHGAQAWWSHNTKTVDWFGQYKDFADDFRADVGFVPQVGYRQTYAEGGYTIRPEGFLRRVRPFLVADRVTDREGGLLSRRISLGTNMDGKWNSFFRLWYAFDRVRAGDVTLPRQQLLYFAQVSPSLVFNQIGVEGDVGQQIDFDGARRGFGANISLFATVRPTNHLELRFNEARRWLNVDLPGGARTRLFSASVDRLRATYTFTPRAFLRVIGQYVTTRRDASLYTEEVARKESGFGVSALFAYKLNWQTVLFVGYGDESELDEATGRLDRVERSFFVKLSYAFQR
jgi:hypothetical protein